MNQRIAIIDYGMGNLHSAGKALEYVAPDADVVITSDSDVVRDADRVVFPGVGAIGECMAEIRRLGFDELVPEIIQQKPMLAICVGMQALLSFSEESGGVDCIDIVQGRVALFDNPPSHGEDKLKVPHMGWNAVQQNRTHPLWDGIAQEARFYFVHSYFVAVEDANQILGTTEYGVKFASALAAANLFAVQFHPEKSQDAGLQLLRNFISWNGVE